MTGDWPPIQSPPWAPYPCYPVQLPYGPVTPIYSFPANPPTDAQKIADAVALLRLLGYTVTLPTGEIPTS